MAPPLNFTPGQELQPEQQLNQSPQQPDTQATPGSQPPPQQPSIFDQVSQTIGQRILQHQQQQNQPANGGGMVKRLLGNFLIGGGSAMMKDAGLPTPYEQDQRDLMNFNQLQNTQALIGLRNAQMQANLPAPVSDGNGGYVMGPNGPILIPPTHQAPIYASQNTAAGRVGAARATGQAGIEKQALANQGKLNAIGLQTQIIAQKGVRFLPDEGPDGKPFYHVMNPFGQEIGQADANVIPQLMQKTASTVEYKQQEDQSWVALPKTTVTSPSIPGKGTPGAAAPPGAGVPAGGPTAKPVMGADGQPLIGLHSGQSRSRGDAANAIEPLIDRATQMLQDPEISNNLGPLAGRWSELEQKVGNLPPKLRQLAGTLTSIYSLAGTMHGWRALQVANEFEKRYGGLEATPESLAGGLSAMRETAESVKQAGFGKPKANTSGISGFQKFMGAK